MSKKKEEEKKAVSVAQEKVTINHSGISDKRQKELSEERVDRDNMDFMNEGYFLLETKVRPDEDNLTSVKFDFAGNNSLIIGALIEGYNSHESVREILTAVADNIMLIRMSEMSGMTPEEFLKKNEIEIATGSIPMSKGGDA